MKMKMKAKPFTTEQDVWLRKHHHPDRTIRDLTEEYNAVWGEARSTETMKHHCKRLGLQQEMRTFTEEQDAWLRKHSGTLSIKDMTALFNQAFGTHRSEGVIKVHCNRSLKIRFLGSHFQTGDPIGTEVVRSGYVWVKVSDKVPQKGEQSGWINWRPKSHVVWEQHHGCMPPKGHIIVFLDGNKQNTNIENLYAVSGKVLREMSKKQWWSSDPDLTLAAIKWCELLYKIKEVAT